MFKTRVKPEVEASKNKKVSGTQQTTSSKPTDCKHNKQVRCSHANNRLVFIELASAISSIFTANMRAKQEGSRHHQVRLFGRKKQQQQQQQVRDKISTLTLDTSAAASGLQSPLLMPQACLGDSNIPVTSPGTQAPMDKSKQIQQQQLDNIKAPVASSEALRADLLIAKMKLIDPHAIISSSSVYSTTLQETSSQSTAVSTPTTLSFDLSAPKNSPKSSLRCCGSHVERHATEMAALKSAHLAQLQALQSQLQAAQSQTASYIVPQNEELEALRQENERLERELHKSQKAKREYADLVESFQEMLRGSIVSSSSDCGSPISEKRCSKCKFARHTEVTSAASLKEAVVSLKESIDVARSHVAYWKQTAIDAEEVSQRSLRQAEFWKTRATQRAASAANTTAPLVPPRQPNHFFMPPQEYGVDIVTRPECKFDSLEETLKASKFWLRPLNRLKSSKRELKRLSMAVSTPNLRAVRVKSSDEQVPACPTIPAAGAAVFKEGLSTPPASESGGSPNMDLVPSPTFSSFEIPATDWLPSPPTSLYSFEE